MQEHSSMQELLKKAQTAKSAEELLHLARENDVSLAPGEAERLFASLQRPKSGELTETELEMAAGGRNSDYWRKSC